MNLDELAKKIDALTRRADEIEGEGASDPEVVQQTSPETSPNPDIPSMSVNGDIEPDKDAPVVHDFTDGTWHFRISAHEHDDGTWDPAGWWREWLDHTYGDERKYEAIKTVGSPVRVRVVTDTRIEKVDE